MTDGIAAQKPKTDWEIAQAASMKPIQTIAEELGVDPDEVELYGRYKAKIGMDYIADKLSKAKDGRLILVTAINPTPAGEGKTTTTVGLGDALNRIGRKAAICLREPSLGPCFGMKGGAAGGGYAQVVPMEDLNLHFTGDFHAIGAANNLLAAMIDNHIYWGNELDIDPERVLWRRCVDMNDRAVRTVTLSSGRTGVEGRIGGFDITVASEVMAILCLAMSLEDLETRLSRVVVAFNKSGQPVTAADIKAHRAMGALLKDAMKPNLVQTLENNPVFVHGGPFANIAHGCNSVLATRLALKHADYVVTEAGFGADLGAEKFIDIKCRKSGLRPDAAVVVATVRALKFHGGIDLKSLSAENPAAVTAGSANLVRHIENLGKFGVRAVVAINHFTSDTDAEIQAIADACKKAGVKAVLCKHWAYGGAGAEDLARAVVDIIESGGSQCEMLYPDDMTLLGKVETIAKEIYRAGSVEPSEKAAAQFAELETLGFGHLPVCIAKTQYSNSTDPKLYGAPTGHVLGVREVRLSAGAEFVVVVCGDIMTMPGLPRKPAAEEIGIGPDGNIVGLF